jgi:hypothetical protein
VSRHFCISWFLSCHNYNNVSIYCLSLQGTNHKRPFPQTTDFARALPFQIRALTLFVQCLHICSHLLIFGATFSLRLSYSFPHVVPHTHLTFSKHFLKSPNSVIFLQYNETFKALSSYTARSQTFLSISASPYISKASEFLFSRLYIMDISPPAHHYSVKTSECQLLPCEMHCYKGRPHCCNLF